MTREKQIEEFANSQVDCEFFDDSLYKGIIIGAKWADENPQGMAKMRKDYELLFLLKKKELIEKACEWIIHQEEMIGISFENDFIERFKKAMDE